MKNNSPAGYIAPCNANCPFCFLNYTHELSRNFLFDNLSPTAIGNIIREVHHQVKEYPAGQVIAYAGDEYKRLMIIIQGAVIGEIVDFEGRAIQIEELHAPDTIASAFIFGDNNQLPVNVTAIEETRLLTIERNDLLLLFKKYDVVLHNYLNIMANRAQHLSRKIKMLGFQTIRGKFAHFLLEALAKTGGDEIRLKNTQEQLATIFGITRPSLARTIREMHKSGYIDARGKNIKILDKNALSKLLV